MNRIFLLWVLCGTVLVCSHSLAQEDITPIKKRIVGGEKTDIKQHPWQVAISVKIDGKNHLCGGSIVALRWIVTAAHCFKKTTGKSDVRTKSGATDYLAAGTWAAIERVILHPDYRASTNENDIALVKLVKSPPSGRVIPIASASLKIPPEQFLEVTGWGATEEGGDTSTVLLRASVPYADSKTCNDASVYNGRIKPGMMCAGHRDGRVDSCQGDSGGPLVWRTSDGPLLVGVVSWGDGCARKLRYGVYTEISVYSDWIKRVLATDSQ